MEEKMLELKIFCRTFPCSSQPNPTWNWLMSIRYMPKELVIFYVIFKTVLLYILWEQFINAQAAIKIPSNWVPLNVMSVKENFMY